MTTTSFRRPSAGGRATLTEPSLLGTVRLFSRCRNKGDVALFDHFGIKRSVNDAGLDARSASHRRDGANHVAGRVSRDAVTATQRRFRPKNAQDSFDPFETLLRILQ